MGHSKTGRDVHGVCWHFCLSPSSQRHKNQTLHLIPSACLSCRLRYPTISRPMGAIIICRLHFTWKSNGQCSGARERRNASLFSSCHLEGRHVVPKRPVSVCAHKARASSLIDAFVTPKREVGGTCGQGHRRCTGGADRRCAAAAATTLRVRATVFV